MPAKRTVLIVVALSAALAGYLYWTSDERRIRRLLDGVADAVSQEEGEGGVGALAEVAGLTSYLAPEVTFEPGEPFMAMTGAQNVVSTVGRLRAIMGSVQLEMSEVQIDVTGSSAIVRAAARLTLRDRDGAESVEARDVEVALDKRDAGWLVVSARVLPAIPRP